MPTRRLSTLVVEAVGSVAKCRDEDHEPKADEKREPGLYEHECPSCHKRTIFNVDPRGRLG